MCPVTETRRIAGMEVLETEALTLTVLFRTLHRGLNCFSKMHHPIDLDPHRRQCPCGLNNCSAQCNRFHVHLQRHQSTMQILAFCLLPATI